VECKLDKITVHYAEFGVGRPIILVHGWPGSHRYMVHDFEPIFDQLPGWRRIYPDLPGMGNTKGPEWLTNQDQMLGVLEEFIDALIPGEHFTLVGSSYGSYLAQGLVFRQAERIDGVFYMVPVVHLPEEARTLPPESATLVEDTALLSELEREESDLFLNHVVVQSRAMLEYIRTFMIPVFEAADQVFLEKILENYDFSFDIYDLPHPFEKPVLFLMGRQDTMVGYANGWQMIEQYPRASFVVLDRAGHGLAIEQKQLFQSLTKDWLFRVQETANVG
jgi:pimeloyl-ACP methyl ester carboxylesterase